MQEFHRLVTCLIYYSKKEGSAISISLINKYTELFLESMRILTKTKGQDLEKLVPKKSGLSNRDGHEYEAQIRALASVFSKMQSSKVYVDNNLYSNMKTYMSFL